MDNIRENWDKTLEIVRGDLTETAYDAWFAPLYPIRVDTKQNILYVETSNLFVINMLNDRYLQLLEGAVKVAFKKSLRVEAVLKEDKKLSEVPKKQELSINNDLISEFYLNPRFNFESFIVGKNNEFAYSAALAVAESPAKQYNPLFIYGGSGLGKTHLMHAIGHYILKNHKDKKVLYVSSEIFTNELISALRDKKIGQFKRKYREIDVLLIDDIQFIEGKESTQEEFFHTFNALFDRNKQIIISSDRPPNKLTTLEDRLKSRFLWSVTADIQPPDYETRVAILMNKAEEENLEITEDFLSVINLIAEKIKLNVRELEGAFTRIVSFSTLLKRPMNTALARDTLKDILTSVDLSISVDIIKKTVCKYYGISLKDMDSSKRNRVFSHPRQVAMYLSKEMTDKSFPSIASSFGGRDHTTVLHAHKKISKDMGIDENLKETISSLCSLINEN